ncbi:MAG TPA: hypothetical protein VNL77_24235 [Roseiflexaceae bacterium]|nr:hypothetical protein [Roseiflexaceae bacterium]
MIPPRTHLRNLVVTILAVTVVLLVGVQPTPSLVNAQQVIVLTQTDTPPPQGDPGTNITLNLSLTNNINDANLSVSPNTTFNITVANQPTGVTVSTPGPIQLANNQTGGASTTFQIQLSLGGNAAPGSYNNLLVTASGTYTPASGGTRNVSASTFASFVITVGGRTATPTTRPTDTPRPTNTPTLTTTVGPACPEGLNDPGGDRAGARLILVDIENKHGICDQGDEDWFKFAAIGGKVYTIDISQMDLGLDLSLELYDESGVRLTANDDFFARTPPPAPTPPRDIRPRIQSWRALKDGVYYIRVRDTANVGGSNKTYTLIINSESYGPTPPTVAEVCRDLFEEDGLPEQARLITSNEIQPRRVLCPAGDADWVTFFGKTGKTYYIYTDTRPYRNNPDFNNQTEAGADTIIFLTDRDGVTLIDFNDDIEGSLDSQIRFVPQADGFYFLQVKNTGDIGNQFIRYDLVLQQCIPEQECGRAPQPAVAPQPTVGAATPTPTNTTVTFPTATMTGTLTPTPTQSSGFLAQGDAKPAQLIDGPLRGFADAAFEQVWQRNDGPVAEGRASRGWLWGPRGLMARAEGYLQAAGGLRQVQYFDKGRMEVNDPAGDRGSRWFVTSGLLVMELVTGRAQVGNNEYLPRGPADIPIAGDSSDPNAPTYASFAAVTTQSAENEVGQEPRETIDRAGRVGVYTGPRRPETRIAHYVPESGHNVPAVFWNYLNARGLVYEGGRARSAVLIDWLFTLGYPVSEPYWMRVRVGGVERDVLVQAFQRRVLTYIPDNPAGWRVEMGNVGRHYYRWRYGEELP